MQGFVLKFEKPIVELEKKIKEMREYSEAEGVELGEEIEKLELKANKLREDIYLKLTPAQRVDLARHPQRPYTRDYIQYMVDDFVELHGDRVFRDDPAIVAGLGKIEDEPVIIIGHQKGRDTKQKIHRNFGMAHPEGYRKALRVMKLAEKYKRPIITLIDTPGAYPGKGAEERGQAEAIARNLFEMAKLRVPVLCIVIGEGASGGALGIGVGDRLLMMEYTWYSVITPEGCAGILYKDDPSKASVVAEALKLTANDLFKQGIIDEIIMEPPGGAHRDHEAAATQVKKHILKHIKELNAVDESVLVDQRIDKYGAIGYYENNPFQKSS